MNIRVILSGAAAFLCAGVLSSAQISPQDWKDTQELLATYAKVQPKPEVDVYYTNAFLSEAPYLPKK